MNFGGKIGKFGGKIANIDFWCQLLFVYYCRWI